MLKINGILKVLTSEEIDERNLISLIPSENIMSPLATSAYFLRASSRYLLPIQINNESYMPGRTKLEELVYILGSTLKRIYKAQNISYACLSGLHQMQQIMFALRSITGTCLVLAPSNCGHRSTSEIATSLGYNVDYLYLNKQFWDIDKNHLKKLVYKYKAHKVLIYLDHTVNIKPFDINELLNLVPSKWIVFYDISHINLFVATGLIKLPNRRNFFYGGSTHKTIPGPQKGVMIYPNNTKVIDLLETTLKNTVSSKHTGSLLSMLITFIEIESFGITYAKQIISNAQTLAKELSREINVIGPPPELTHTHQVLFPVKDVNLTTIMLAKAGIVTTPDQTPFSKDFGVRLGVQEITRLGMKEAEMKLVGSAIIYGLKNNPSQSKLIVSNLVSKFNTVVYCHTANFKNNEIAINNPFDMITT